LLAQPIGNTHGFFVIRFYVAAACFDMPQLVAFTTHNWRFIMKTFISSNALARRLMLASAGLLLCANGAFAAEVAGDAQMQASDLLSGTVGGQAKFAAASSAIPTDDGQGPDVDAQEQARDLLLGKSFASTAPQAAGADSQTDAMPAASVQSVRRVDIGGQEMAQQMVLRKGV
jgi:hypothetical protein